MRFQQRLLAVQTQAYEGLEIVGHIPP